MELKWSEWKPTWSLTMAMQIVEIISITFHPHFPCQILSLKWLDLQNQKWPSYASPPWTFHDTPWYSMNQWNMLKFNIIRFTSLHCLNHNIWSYSLIQWSKTWSNPVAFPLPGQGTSTVPVFSAFCLQRWP